MYHIDMVVVDHYGLFICFDFRYLGLYNDVSTLC
jgi:hypothetical protein